MASERSFQHIEWYDGYRDVDTHNPLLPAVVEFSTKPWSVHSGTNPLVLLQDIVRTRFETICDGSNNGDVISYSEDQSANELTMLPDPILLASIWSSYKNAIYKHLSQLALTKS